MIGKHKNQNKEIKDKGKNKKEIEIKVENVDNTKIYRFIDRGYRKKST